MYKSNFQHNMRLNTFWAAARSKAAVLLLFIYYILLLPLFVCVWRGVVLGPSFVLQYFVSFLVLQSSRRERKSWLLYV